MSPDLTSRGVPVGLGPPGRATSGRLCRIGFTAPRDTGRRGSVQVLPGSRATSNDPSRGTCGRSRTDGGRHFRINPSCLLAREVLRDTPRAAALEPGVTVSGRYPPLVQVEMLCKALDGELVSELAGCVSTGEETLLPVRLLAGHFPDPLHAGGRRRPVASVGSGAPLDQPGSDARAGYARLAR